MHACACCGFPTLTESPPGSFEICPVCGWEDDDAQFRDRQYAGGANPVSLAQAQANFLKHGAITEALRAQVRMPTDLERKWAIVAPELRHLILKLDEFRSLTIDLDELQQILRKTAESLTSRDDRGLRQRLQDAESQVELIRFTVDKERVLDEVLRIVAAVEIEIKVALEADGGA